MNKFLSSVLRTMTGSASYLKHGQRHDQQHSPINYICTNKSTQHRYPCTKQFKMANCNLIFLKTKNTTKNYMLQTSSMCTRSSM